MILLYNPEFRDRVTDRGANFPGLLNFSKYYVYFSEL